MLEMILGEQLINGLPALGIASRTNAIPGLVDHPQFGNGFFLLDPRLGERFHFGVIRHEHVLKDPPAIDPHKSELDNVLGLSAGTDGLDADPSAESD